MPEQQKRSQAGQAAGGRRPSTTRRLLGMAALCGCVLGIVELRPGARFPIPNRNRLLLEQESPVEAAYPVALNEPMEFDGLGRAEICRLRRDAVAQHPKLVAEGYRPSHAVFGQIEDGRPWWGIEGQYLHGPGPRSTAGRSEESRFILNPFLLVAADFTGLTPWSPEFAWDRERIESEEPGRTGFPFYCRPARLVWWPADSRAEVTYELSGHLRRLRRLTERPMTLADCWFCLLPDNARDLNLHFLHVPPRTMHNVSQADPPNEPVPIRHFLHRGGSCGYPGGCNNGSPYQPELDGYRVTGLPASLEVLLWHDCPSDVRQPAEMRFRLRIE